MGQKSQKNIFEKRKKNFIENLTFKKGKKETTEKFFKKCFKKLQKEEKSKISVSVLKAAIIKTVKSHKEAKQVLKRGKRKQMIQTLVFLVSEKARFSDAWLNLLKLAKQNNGNLADKIALLLKSKIIRNDKAKNLEQVFEKKTSVKFRW